MIYDEHMEITTKYLQYIFKIVWIYTIFTRFLLKLKNLNLTLKKKS